MEENDLIIALQSIGRDGLDIDRRLAPERLEEVLGPGAPVTPSGEARVRARLDKLDETVHIRGRLTLELGTVCARCLDPIRLGIDAPFQFTLFPAGTEPEANEAGEVMEDDMEVATYCDQKVDLGALIHDEIYLALPMHPSCENSVGGKCPGFDQKLRSLADGQLESQNPFYQALKNLKAKRD